MAIESYLNSAPQPLPQGAATEASLLQLIALQAGQATPYTDDTGALFFRGAGGLGWIDANNQAYTPTGTVIVAGSSNDKELLTTHYDVTFDSGNGWAVGDEIAWVQFIDTKTQQVLAEIWVNETAGTVIAAVPANEREAHESKEHKIAEAIRDHLPLQDGLIEINYWIPVPRFSDANLLPSNAKRRSAVVVVNNSYPVNLSPAFFATLNTTGTADGKSPCVMGHLGSTTFADATLTTTEISGYANEQDCYFHVLEQGY